MSRLTHFFTMMLACFFLPSCEDRYKDYRNALVASDSSDLVEVQMGCARMKANQPPCDAEYVELPKYYFKFVADMDGDSWPDIITNSYELGYSCYPCLPSRRYNATFSVEDQILLRESVKLKPGKKRGMTVKKIIRTPSNFSYDIRSSMKDQGMSLLDKSPLPPMHAYSPGRDSSYLLHTTKKILSN